MTGNCHPDLKQNKINDMNRITAGTFKSSKVIFILLQNSGIFSDCINKVTKLVLDKCWPGKFFTEFQTLWNLSYRYQQYNESGSSCKNWVWHTLSKCDQYLKGFSKCFKAVAIATSTKISFRQTLPAIASKVGGAEASHDYTLYTHMLCKSAWMQFKKL